MKDFIDKFPEMIIAGVISFVIALIFGEYIRKFFKWICFVIRRKIVKDELLIGMYFGYYLNKNSNSNLQLKESIWDILPDIKKGKYIIKIYKIDNDKQVRKQQEKLSFIKGVTKFDKNNRKKILSTKLLKCKYKGKMWKEKGHLLFSFAGTKHTETIFERRQEGTKPDENPIIGISLAINSNENIRSNVSILSRKKLNQTEVCTEIRNFCSIERDTYNLKINRNQK
jgi:hypothetical protein